MSILDKSISGHSDYDTKIDDIDKEQIELVKLFYLTDDPHAKKVIETKMNQLNSQRTKTGFWGFIKTMVTYALIFALLVVNFIAVSLSLSCNKNSNIFMKIFSAIFAMIFGIIYIAVNFAQYKVKTGEYCAMCKDNPFPLF